MKQSRKARKAFAAGILAAIAAHAGSAAAEEPFSLMNCRAGTISNLAKAEDMVSFSIDHRGILMAQEGTKAFDNFTQRCIGSTAIVRGVPHGKGFCRNVDPASGDFVLLEWTADKKPGSGTVRFIYGTGKWKGITGGGAYQPVAATRPVDEGTYQSCITSKGTFTVPKM